MVTSPHRLRSGALCAFAFAGLPVRPGRGTIAGAIMSLNPDQLEAVEHGDGALLILAGAGSGKTRVLVHRIARLIEQGKAEPWRILAVTFTNKAAGELVDRCRTLIGSQAGELWAGTFHGIGARICRYYAEDIGYPRAYTIFDDSDQLRLLKELAGAAKLDAARFRPEALRAFIDQAKNEALGPSEAAQRVESDFEEEAAKIYAVYQRRLKRMGSMDFGDLLLNTLLILRTVPEAAERFTKRFRHVLVDEYQDTNHAQYLMVSLLAAASGNLCVVGDDDQSIYGWRGADTRNILEFERDFPGAKIVRLEQNYRSTANIIEAAAAVIDNNGRRHRKHIWTEQAAGAPVCIYTAGDEKDEARYILERLEALGDELGRVAIFYRTNAQSRAIEEALVRAHLPYVIVGGTRFYERREIKDLIAYLRFVHNPGDDFSLERIVNVPARGIGKTSWERLKNAAGARGLAIWEHIGRGGAASLGPAARSRVGAFHTMAGHWLGQGETGVAGLLRKIIDDSGYIAFLESRPEDDAESRIENVRELVTVAKDFDRDFATRRVSGDTPEISCLTAFLEQLALVSDIDKFEAKKQAVSLMTVHNSKGLEFEEVFVAGMEEGIFPHSRSVNGDGDDNHGIEEERRLFYVAMTRAKTRLTLIHARRRHLFGSEQMNLPSCFLDEIPDKYLSRKRSSAGRDFSARSQLSRLRWEEEQTPGSPPPPGQALSSPGRYKAGMKVVHPTFGSGTVRKSEGSGDSEKLLVQFRQGGIKKLVARFARLEIV